jgi:hypothetical protein
MSQTNYRSCKHQELVPATLCYTCHTYGWMLRKTQPRRLKFFDTNVQVPLKLNFNHRQGGWPVSGLSTSWRFIIIKWFIIFHNHGISLAFCGWTSHPAPVGIGIPGNCATIQVWGRQKRCRLCTVTMDGENQW